MITNEDRADAALVAVIAFREEMRGDPLDSDDPEMARDAMQTAITDLVCDLMHLCDAHSLDPIKTIEVAAAGYAQEKKWPEDGIGPAGDEINVTVLVTIDHIARGLRRERNGESRA